MADKLFETLPDTAVFVRELYARGGFKSWADFARESGVLSSSLSHWKNGNMALEGQNLLRLIRAVQRVAPDAFGSAVTATSPADVSGALQGIRDQLDSIEKANDRLRRALKEAEKDSRPPQPSPAMLKSLTAKEHEAAEVFAETTNLAAVRRRLGVSEAQAKAALGRAVRKLMGIAEEESERTTALREATSAAVTRGRKPS